MKIVVVGGGIAGTAAAHAARGAGADVVWIVGTSGATVLAPGAFDLTPWQDRPSAEALTSEAKGLVTALGYVASDGPAWIATSVGVVRPCRLRDAALLDLAVLPRGARIALPRVVHAEWDADALARTLGSDPYALERELRFEAVDISIHRFGGERDLPHLALAARHDAEDRSAWLAARLQAHSPAPDAWLLPPWLGTRPETAARIRGAVGAPLGEAISLPPSPSGARFRQARDALFPRRVEGFVKRVTVDLRVETETGETFTADAVVLATGGIAVGGVYYTPAEATLAGELPTTVTPAFALGIDADVTLGESGRPLLQPGSAQGPQPEHLTWPHRRTPVLERIGVLSAQAGIYAAGDVMADAPRTWLGALESGLRAGAAACAFAGRLSESR